MPAPGAPPAGVPGGRTPARRPGLRRQLLALFAVFLGAGLAIFALDRIGQQVAVGSIEAVQVDALTRVRHLRALSDSYANGVVDTTFRTRNSLITWREARQTLAAARSTAAREWDALAASRLDAEGAALLAQSLAARARADTAAQTLAGLLEGEDVLALGAFADGQMYAAVDPVLQRLQRLEALAQARADAVVERALARTRWLGHARLALGLACVLLVFLLGRRMMREGYRGIRALTEVARAMGRHEYDLVPDPLPTGEFGEVMDSFLAMREQVVRMERELTGQLANNLRVHEALERREQFQRLLLEAAQAGIVAIDARGVFVQANPFAERLLGWPAGALVGRETLDAVLDPDAIQTLARALGGAYGCPVPADWRALRELARHHEAPREFTMRHQRGRALPVLLAVSPMQEQGGGEGLLVVMTDLSMQKRLERALRDSEARARDASEAKSAFLAAMSHEIRTPMIGVTGMIEVLAHTPLDDGQRRSLAIIHDSAQALLHIIGDILDFSKIEAGRLEIESVPTDLPALLRIIAASHAETASRKGLLLLCELPDAIAPAHYVDPVRLRQVLANFLSNAVKFTEHGRITLSLVVLGHDPDNGALGADRLRVRVVDTGIGISAQAQARLFQPFAQAEADTTRRFGGTGLGLAISRRLVDLMGGSLGLESAPGQGTSLVLEFTLQRAPADEVAGPAIPAAGAAANPHAPSVAEAEAAGQLVLLVDDHPTNRLVIQRQLALAGFACETACDGEEALVMWRSGRFGALLSDVHMPNMDGYQLAQQLRIEEAQRGLARTPVVALTASALKGEAERCLAAGMDDYLAKPVGIAALGSTLARWLGPPAAADRVVDPAEAGGPDDVRRTGGARAGGGRAGAGVPCSPSPASVRPGASLLAAAPVASPRGLPADILDHAVLDDLTGGAPAENRLLLADFLGALREDLAELDGCLAREAIDEVARQAHKIKGAARLVGANALALEAAGLEASARANDREGLSVGHTALVDAGARLRGHVARMPTR